MSRLLDGRVCVLLTGGTSGVGAALRRDLLAQGHRVVVLARRASALEPAAGLTLQDSDLGDTDRLPGIVAEIIARHPDISILINNAGVQNAHPLLDPATTPATLHAEIAVNLLAPAILSRAVAPLLVARGKGAIVNVTSGLAWFPKQDAGLYAASKAGLHSFTQSLRYQMEGTGVVVVEVVLPLVDTPMTAGRGAGKISAGAASRAILAGLARGRPVIRVGVARALPVIDTLAPWLGRRMLRTT